MACGLIAVFSTSVGGQRLDDISFQYLKLDANDLAEVTGVNIYKFQVAMPKGQKFRIVFREVDAKEARPRVLHQMSLVKESDTPVTLRVGFMRSDRKLASFLLSEEKEAEYRVDCSGCSPSGYATIVPLPLANIPLTDKTLMVSASDKQAKEMGKGTALIRVVARDIVKGGMPTSFPRAELVIEPE
jgi:hypothetical protein